MRGQRSFPLNDAHQFFRIPFRAFKIAGGRRFPEVKIQKKDFFPAPRERKGKIPRKGDYDEAFLQQLDEYLLRLDGCKGRFVVK